MFVVAGRRQNALRPEGNVCRRRGEGRTPSVRRAMFVVAGEKAERLPGDRVYALIYKHAPLA